MYNGISNEPNGPDKAWVANSMAIRLAQMVRHLTLPFLEVTDQSCRLDFVRGVSMVQRLLTPFRS